MKIKGYFGDNLNFENIKGTSKFVGRGTFTFKDPLSIDEVYDIKHRIFSTIDLDMESVDGNMEDAIEDIRKRVEDFMEKYNCSVKVETTSYGCTIDGKIACPRAKIIINS